MYSGFFREHLRFFSFSSGSFVCARVNGLGLVMARPEGIGTDISSFFFDCEKGNVRALGGSW